MWGRGKGGKEKERKKEKTQRSNSKIIKLIVDPVLSCLFSWYEMINNIIHVFWY